jgi:hypothetical protein
MHVELLFWDGCPSHPAALADLRAQMAALGLDPGEVELREVTSAEQAERDSFIGSPTIRIDGVDVVDTGDEPPALNCRVYRSRDGRILARPDPGDVRDALEAALVKTAGASTHRGVDTSPRPEGRAKRPQTPSEKEMR